MLRDFDRKKWEPANQNLDHIEGRGCELFESVCRMDLEGIVAKREDSIYRAREKPSPHWIKIKNPNYNQAEGRQEMFEELAFSRK